MAEERVLRLFQQTNRPRNVQGVADMLATAGVKKAQAEKACAALAEAGKIVCKEFGKTKLYIPSQEGLEELQPEEKAQKLAELQKLQTESKERDSTNAGLKRELQAANSTLTMEELRAKVQQLQGDLESLKTKLTALKSGAVLISSEDVAAAEKSFVRVMDAWTRNKRIFRAVWDQVSENIEGKQADLFEEIGVDSDEAVGEELRTYQQLLPKKMRR